MLMLNLDRRPATGALRIMAGLGMLIVTLAAAGFRSGAATVAVPSAASSDAEPPAGAPVPAAAPAAPTQKPAAAEAPRSSEAAPLQPAGAAQDSASVLSGILVDQSGGGLPGVRVSLSRTRDGQREERSTHSYPSGSFRLTGIPPGEHDLELRLPGFASVVQRVSVPAGASSHYSLMLRVGTLEETVTVGQNAAPPGTVTAEQNRAAEAIRGAVARAQREPITAPDGLIEPRLPGRPVRVGGNIQAPRKTRDVWPRHPVVGPGARGGVVALQTRIGENGRIEAVLPLWSSSEDLTVAASAAVWQWEFTPTRLNGRPIAVDMFVTVNFAGT